MFITGLFFISWCQFLHVQHPPSYASFQIFVASLFSDCEQTPQVQTSKPGQSFNLLFWSHDQQLTSSKCLREVQKPTTLHRSQRQKGLNLEEVLHSVRVSQSTGRLQPLQLAGRLANLQQVRGRRVTVELQMLQEVSKLNEK